MDKYEIQRLRELPIEGVAERLGLRVVRHRALCCFHDDHTPSLHFNVKHNTYRCFSCGAHGGVIDLAMAMLSKCGLGGSNTFVETCKWLANEHNIITDEYKPRTKKAVRERKADLPWLEHLVAHPVLNAEARHFLFEERKIDESVVRWLGVSSLSAPAPCWRYGKAFFNSPSLLIPYRDVNGMLVSVQARYLGTAGKSGGEPPKPRFQFPPGAQCHIFNLPVLRTLGEGEKLWITEGSTDCMALMSSGRKTIAIPSATLLNEADVRMLEQSLPPSVQLHMIPDRDAPGEHLYAELVKVALGMRRTIVKHELPEGYKDFGEWWRKAGKT